MTTAKYISQAFFSSNSNPSYSGFALWRDQVLHSPEIAIAHLSQGLRSPYHWQRGSFEFLSFQYAWQSRFPLLILKFGERLCCLAPTAPRRGSRHKELVTSHQKSYHMTLSANNGSPTSADHHLLQIIILPVCLFFPVLIAFTTRFYFFFFPNKFNFRLYCAKCAKIRVVVCTTIRQRLFFF